MEIRDVIHGSIVISRTELPIIDSLFFQRLRQIKQLGFAEYSFPTATHNRYVHSLGAMETATKAFDTVFGGPRSSGGFTPDRLRLFETYHKSHARFRAVVRLAALLHDIGHGPLSHTTEFAMPELKKLAIPQPPAGAKAAVGKTKPTSSRQATHEDYTLKIILDSPLTKLIETAGAQNGFTPWHVASLITNQFDSYTDNDDFFFETIDGSSSSSGSSERIDFRPILSQLISSELDADRMDYLRRDSYFAGVSYGQFDFDWLLGNLSCHIKHSKCYLALQHRALYSFEDFLLSRYHMFLMVYFHYKSVVYDAMLGQYLGSDKCEYVLPADIEKYGECNDAHLYSHLNQSKNIWARRIIEKRPYRMLAELHSGIPATKMATNEQARLLSKIEKDLKAQEIHSIQATSTGEVSKYFRKPGHPIFVRYDNHYSAVSFIPLEQCTDLYTKYSEKRSITRLYVPPERFHECRYQGRNAPLKYEDANDSEEGLELFKHV